MPKVLIKRGTRSQLDTAKNASGMNAGELYLITDEGKIAVGTAVNAYVEAQAQDGDLDAIAALSGTSGLLKKTAANTWSLDTATYLTSAAIGSSVQAYDADLDTWATKSAPSGTVVGTSDTQTLSAKTLTLPKINDTSSNNTYNFGVSELTADRTVTLPLLTADDTFVFAGFTQTLTNKTLTDPAITGCILEDVYQITDGAAFEVDPSNGSIQYITLGAARVPKATNFAAGEAVILMVDDGSAYTITWTDATWGGSGVVWLTTSGTAPTLAATGYTAITLWKVGTQVYGKY